ncbi:FAD binding domain-containing protein [Luteimicrobium subarcticum]|uniref:CO/xanthine dehydrogenase FAD-binding subunit n=1 Tax=Luteimicrobium subarcticum TaxID=620910 RepID=A0A2M8W1F1_9MICO|nr:FAD binding domain-containing protein [Luteimicrobium subarcticum]PJI84728.1 CO/xanthine dehydrogenase FAD-binding subunit [Luteimicrobium subarcticum]
MDLVTVETYRRAHERADLVLAPGERFVAGGTWMFSEPQPGVTGLVDVTGMGWVPWEGTLDGLRVAATCRVGELARMPAAHDWRAHPLFGQCCHALLASFKVWNLATVGGNVCNGFAAGALVSLCAALDAEAVLWPAEGGERRVAVADLVVGNGVTTLAPGEVLRAVEIPGRALRARTAFRKIALSAHGRSGAVVIGRLDEDGAFVLTVTAATSRPVVLRYAALPEAGAVRDDVLAVDAYFTDPHGPADWRRGVSAVLADEVLSELRELREPDGSQVAA